MDVTLLIAHAIAGGISIVVAIIALWGDRRRIRRRDPDAVGFMPWTQVFFAATLCACVLLGLAGREWLAG